jgi:hypothetical protein
MKSLATRYGDRLLGLFLKQTDAGAVACHPHTGWACGCTFDGFLKQIQCNGTCRKSQIPC